MALKQICMKKGQLKAFNCDPHELNRAAEVHTLQCSENVSEGSQEIDACIIGMIEYLQGDT